MKTVSKWCTLKGSLINHQFLWLIKQRVILSGCSKWALWSAFKPQNSSRCQVEPADRTPLFPALKARWRHRRNSIDPSHSQARSKQTWWLRMPLQQRKMEQQQVNCFHKSQPMGLKVSETACSPFTLRAAKIYSNSLPIVTWSTKCTQITAMTLSLSRTWTLVCPRRSAASPANISRASLRLRNKTIRTWVTRKRSSTWGSGRPGWSRNG